MSYIQINLTNYDELTKQLGQPKNLLPGLVKVQDVQHLAKALLYNEIHLKMKKYVTFFE